LAKAQEKKFFHWFLEFPEVFANNGFDCILGNPPYLGGSKISTNYGSDFLNRLKSSFENSLGQSDLASYFVQRVYNIIKHEGFTSLITTNTIAQGDTKATGIDILLKNNGQINFANPSVNWPGVAAVVVTLITINKANGSAKPTLVNQNVENISSFLKADDEFVPPMTLKGNSGIAYLGTGVVGDGFIINNHEAETLLLHKQNKEVVFPYLTGKDLYSSSTGEASRSIINFHNWSLEKSNSFRDCFKIIEERVKPVREKNKDKRRREIWWQFSRPTIELYNAIKNKNKVLVHTRVTKTHAFEFVPRDQVFSDALVVFDTESYTQFSVLQSSIHENWAWKYCSTMKSDRRYSLTDCFENFPFPKSDFDSSLGKDFQVLRQNLLQKLDVGLTKLYGLFNDPTVVIDEISSLRKLLLLLDNEILKGYEWHDIELKHGFHEVDYLPENDRVRYTIHPEARKEVLKRLLLLNHERFEEEVAQGLHKRQDVEAYYQQKGKPIPAGTIFSDKKSSTTIRAPKMAKAKSAQEPQSQYGLFSEEPTHISEGSKVTLENADRRTFKYHILKTAVKGEFTGDFKQINLDSGLAQAISDKKDGDQIEFGGQLYTIISLE
jgi:hypothetical protein